MSNIPTNTDDIIDSRDVIARIQSLERDLENAYEYGNEPEFEDWLLSQAKDANGEFNAEAAELLALRKLQREAEDYAPDWHYGATLIRDTYFEDHAREFAEEVGAVSSDDPWPTNHIDWKAAAEELKEGFTSVDFDGVTYWVR